MPGGFPPFLCIGNGFCGLYNLFNYINVIIFVNGCVYVKVNDMMKKSIKTGINEI